MRPGESLSSPVAVPPVIIAAAFEQPFEFWGAAPPQRYQHIAGHTAFAGAAAETAAS